tara:strand:+ start:457 stop:1293 length:837 start_codon:yes stop_codon:yes gene_type:complete
MTIALVSIGFIVFISFFSNRLIILLQEEIPFKIILKDSNSAEVYDLMNFLKNNEEVNIQKTQFVQKELAVNNLKQKLGKDFLAPLDNENPLPDIVNLYIKPDYHNSKILKDLKIKIENQSIVASVIFPVKISDQLLYFKSKFLIISIFISAIFLIFSAILIYNNIRLTIYANRYNLNVMQLVGATRSFIQKPYLKRSIVDGFTASVISTFILGFILLTIIYIGLGNNDLILEKLLVVFSKLEISLFFILIISLGILISGFSNWLVLRRILSLKINFYK